MSTKPEQGLSARVRAAFQAIGAEVTQVVEAGVPGPSDLILEWPNRDYWWIELKSSTAPFRTAQRQFLKNRWKLNRNAFLLKDFGISSAPTDIARPPGGIIGPARYRLWRGIDALVPGLQVWSNETLDAAWILRTMRIEHDNYRA